MLQHLKELFAPEPTKCMDLQNAALIDIDKGSTDGISKVEERNNSKQSQLVMEEKMEDLCRGLSGSTQRFSHSTRKWLDELEAYVSEYGRLLYSTISNFIYGLDEEGYANFETNLYCVFEEVMNSSLPENTDDAEKAIQLKRQVMKFYDHVNLARRQFTLYSDKKDNLEELISAQIAPKLAESAKDLTSQLVGMIAIFTALSFVVFGGISSLESLFAKLSCITDSVLPVIITALAWALCMGNLLFAFMYFVLHILGIKPELSADKGNLIQKYPLVFLMNYIIVSGLLACTAVMVAEKHGIGKGIYNYILSHNDCVFVIASVILVCVILLVGLLLWRLYKKTDPI